MGQWRLQVLTSADAMWVIQESLAMRVAVQQARQLERPVRGARSCVQTLHELAQFKLQATTQKHRLHGLRCSLLRLVHVPALHQDVGGCSCGVGVWDHAVGDEGGGHDLMGVV